MKRFIPFKSTKSIFKFKILRNVLLVSIIIIMGLPIFNVLYIYPSFENSLIRTIEAYAVNTAGHLSRMIFDKRESIEAGSFSKDVIEAVKEDFKLEKIKIFSKTGEIIYSSDSKDIGKINKKKYFSEIIAKGQVFTKVVNKDTKSLEDRIVTVDVVETYVPLMKGDTFRGAFEIYHDITERKEQLDTLISRSFLVLFSLAFCLFITIIVILLSESKTIAAQKEAANNLKKSHNELEVCVHEQTAELEKSNALLEREIQESKQKEVDKHRLEKQLRQAQKMEAIGTLAGGIAHDFNNILSAIMGFTELAMDDAEKGSLLRNNLQDVLNASNRAKDLVHQILTFSRQTEQERKPINVKHIAKEVLKLMRASLPATIKIQDNLRSNTPIDADPTQIHQVLMNLCTNAGHAMQEKGGILTVDLSDTELDSDSNDIYPDLTPGPHLKLTVNDTGCGMPAHVLDRIFDPFFTTKAEGEGTGMGLSVVHGIVKSHGGAITVYSEPGNGTVFHILLPTVETELAPEKTQEEVVPTGTECILFVDDEKILVKMGRQLLESLGYEVTTRTSAIEALELFKAQPDRFDLVITDMTMPNMTGDELAKALFVIRPDIPIIICSGFSTRMNKAKAKATGIQEFIIKPFLKGDVARAIRSALDTPSESLAN